MEDLFAYITESIEQLPQVTITAINEGNEVTPKNLKELKRIILVAIKNQGTKVDLNFINTSLIKSFDDLFTDINMRVFTGKIDKWDTSNVVSMNRTFNTCYFNGDISKWNTSNVKKMTNMFGASIFNQDISNWDMGNVINTEYMFQMCSFNKDISKWNVRSIKKAQSMFKEGKFAQNIDNWNLPKNCDTTEMFKNCPLDKKGLEPEWYGKKI